MKKIISLILLLFAFSISVNAQENKIEKADNLEVLAKNDTKALTDYLNLEGPITEDFYRLMLYKHKNLAQENDKAQRMVISEIITKKIEATFNADQMSKLSKNPILFKQITH
jgi:hypothetical protein